MKMVMEVRIGSSLMPQRVWLRMSPMSGTTAMESPKLKATLSMLARAFFLGKRATINVYPGKNNSKGNPRIIRKTFEGKKVMTIMSRIARIFISSNSF